MTTASEIATLKAMLKACIEQIQEYSSNDMVIGSQRDYTVNEIELALNPSPARPSN